MIFIVICNAEDLPGETDAVNALFDAGLEIFHLRKPGYSQEETEVYLRKLKPGYLKRIVIHQHYGLLSKFNLKGIHLKEQYFLGLEDAEIKELIKSTGKRNMHVSLSIHSTEMLAEMKYKFSYVFLSPVFESISKAGYKSQENLLELPETKQELIALGGISEENISQLSGKGFSGIAILGALWNKFSVHKNAQELVKIYTQLKVKAGQAKWKQKDLIY